MFPYLVGLFLFVFLFIRSVSHLFIYSFIHFVFFSETLKSFGKYFPLCVRFALFYWRLYFWLFYNCELGIIHKIFRETNISDPWYAQIRSHVRTHVRTCTYHRVRNVRFRWSLTCVWRNHDLFFWNIYCMEVQMSCLL